MYALLSACIHISINIYRSVRINALDIVMYVYACLIHYVYIIASFNACKNANIDICINSCINGYNNACVMHVCILKWFLDVWTRYPNKSAFYRHIWRRLMRELHWLPVRFRIKYKIAVLTHRVRHSREPGYLHSMLRDYAPARVLRSGDQHLLKRPRTSTAKASRAFRCSAPVVWNSLSVNTRCATSPGSFKKLLKTELFASAFIDG